jgi:hypothetical protein
MKKKLNFILLGTSLGLIGGGEAQAKVYISDPQYDMYKQKTDQTFYDMYQNPNSALGGQVQSNTQAQQVFNSIPTSNHFAEGTYLDRTKQSSVAGGSIPDGAETWITVFGDRYRIVATANGIEMYDRWGRKVNKVEKIRTTTGVSNVRDEGRYYQCGKSTCERNNWTQVGTARGWKKIFIPQTGYAYQYDVELIARRPVNRYSYSCGKSTCYRYNYGRWNYQVGKVLNVNSKYFNLANAIVKGGYSIDIDSGATWYKPPSQPVVKPKKSRGRGNGANNWMMW